MSYKALAVILESIGKFLNHLGTYTETSVARPAVDKIVVKLVVELISALALIARKPTGKRRQLCGSFLASMLPHSPRRSDIVGTLVK